MNICSNCKKVKPLNLQDFKMDSMISFYLLVLLLLSDCSNANSKVVISLSSSLVTEFNPLTLSCKYMGNQTVNGTNWRRNNAGVGYLLADCVVFIQPDPDLYDYSCPSTNEAILTIKNITTANHGDQWRCMIYNVIDSITVTSNVVTISVRVAVQWVNMIYPNVDVITIREGNVVELSCETSFGRPEPDITWYKDEGTQDIYDDVKLIDNVTYQNSKHLNVTDLYTTFSTLLYTPTRFDHGMRIYCLANSTHETIVVSAKKPQFNVEYGPVNIDFNTSTDVFELDEQTRGDVVLCSADCNPSCIVSWFKLGQNSPISRHSLLDLGVLSRDDNGTYVCKATRVGTNLELTKSLIVLVSHKPDVPSDLKFLSCYDVPMFSWRGGSNGGLSQTFVIQTSRTYSNNWTNQTKVKENDDLCLNINGMYVAVLSKMPTGQYDVRVIAENRIGQSEPLYMQQVINIISNEGSSSEQKSVKTALIVGVILGVFIIALITYGIYMTVVVRRLKSNTERATGTSDGNSDVGNERHPYVNTSMETADGPNERGTTNANLNPDVEQYVELDRVNLSDSSTYEKIDQQ